MEICCYEITAVPVHRDGNPVLSPAAELAARLMPGQILRFYLHRDRERIRCFLSCDAGQEPVLAFKNLPGWGYLSVPATPPAGTTGILLGRQYCNRMLSGPDHAAHRVSLPVPIRFEEKNADALIQALYATEAGSGIHFAVCVMEDLSSGPVRWLSRMQIQDPVINSLLVSDRLYQIAGCIYGSPSAQEQLLPEVRYAFPGLSSHKVSPMQVSDHILNLYKNQTLPESLRELATTFLPEELEALTNLRGCAGRVGLPLNRDTIFGISSIPSSPAGKQIQLGVSARGQPVTMPLSDLNRHVLISAPSGAGKGNMIVNLVLQLHKNEIPFLILESQKQELHHLRKKIPNLQTWVPQGGQFVFNPFALPANITKKEYHPFLKTMLTEAFDAEGPLESFYEEALNLVYAMHGYTDDATKDTPGTTPFGLNEFIGTFSQILDTQNYSAKTQQDVKSAGLNRLNSLFNMDRDLHDTVATIPAEMLLCGENLLQLNCLTGHAREIFATLLLLQISALLRLRGTTAASKEDIRLVILVDEAHTLLQSTPESQGKSKRFVAEYDNLLKTLRSLGVGVITISQTTEGIPRYLTDGCHTKLFLGGSPYSGVDTYRLLLHADDTAVNHLYLLKPGDGLYCTPSIPQAVYFHTPFLLDALKIHEDDYEKKNRFLEAHPEITLKTFVECSTCPGKSRCSQQTKSEARRYSSTLVSRYGEALRNDSKKGKEILLREICAHTDDIPLRWCIVIQVIRDLNRRHPGTMDLAALIRQLKTIWK